MGRGKRVLYKDAIYHVMSRGNRGGKIVRDDADRLCFLEMLARAHDLYHARWRSFMIMKTHYHMAVQTPFANLPEIMKCVNGGYTQAWNRRHRRFGHVFAGRYKAIVIEDDRYAQAVLSYIAHNPVESGYVKHPADWLWSSYRATAGLVEAPDFLDLDWLQGFYGGRTRSEAQMAHREHIENGQSAYDGSFDAVVVGSPEFKGNVRDHIGRTMSQLLVPRSYRALARPPLGKLFARADDDLERRNLMILRAQVVYGYRQSEIARTLAVHPDTISKIVCRMKKQRFFLAKPTGARTCP